MLNRLGRNTVLVAGAAVASAVMVLFGANPAAAPELDSFRAESAVSVDAVAFDAPVAAVATSYDIDTANFSVELETELAAPSIVELARTVLEVKVAPTGDQITAIGDSLMVGATPHLEELLPGISIDGRVGRPMVEGMTILDQLNDQDAIREYVVLGLATNAGVTVEQFDKIIEKIGPNRTVVMVNAYGDRSWIPGGNEQVEAAAVKYPGQIVVADWNGLIAEHPEYIGPDGIHANAEGKVAYAQLVLDTLNSIN